MLSYFAEHVLMVKKEYTLPSPVSGLLCGSFPGDCTLKSVLGPQLKKS